MPALQILPVRPRLFPGPPLRRLRRDLALRLVQLEALLLVEAGGPAPIIQRGSERGTPHTYLIYNVHCSSCLAVPIDDRRGREVHGP